MFLLLKMLKGLWCHGFVTKVRVLVVEGVAVSHRGAGSDSATSLGYESFLQVMSPFFRISQHTSAAKRLRASSLGLDDAAWLEAWVEPGDTVWVVPGPWDTCEDWPSAGWSVGQPLCPVRGRGFRRDGSFGSFQGRP